MTKVLGCSKKNNIFKLSAIFFALCLLLCALAGFSSLLHPNTAKAATEEELLAQVKSAELEYDKALSNQYLSQARYNECRETIEYASWKIPEIQNQIGIRAKDLYINNHGGILQLLLGSSNLDDFVKHLDYANRIIEKDLDLIKQCKDLKEQAQIAQTDIWTSLETSQQSAQEAAMVLAGAQGALMQLQAQNIPVFPPSEVIPGGDVTPGGGGGGDEGGGGGGDEGGGGGGGGPVPHGDSIVERALSCIGKPYGWGCAGPNAFDCSGLVSYAYSGVFEHYYCTYTIRNEEGDGLNGWYRVDEPYNGTCCCSMGHCGIYYNGQMIHAPEPGKTVTIGPIQSDMLFYNRD